MASLQRDADGNAIVQFTGPDQKRRTIRLGEISERNGNRFVEKLESLLKAVKYGNAIDDEVSQWTAKLADDVAEKFAEYGLLPKRENVPLGKLIADFIEQHPTKKEQTKVTMRHAERNMVACFGYDMPLRKLTPADGDAFRAYLLKPKKQGGAGLNENTACRRCKIAKQFLRSAVRRGLLVLNPFADLGGTVRGNKARMYFVTRAEAEKVLKVCPDLEWKLIFALSRFGGLRCPSEHLGLRWSDIDWEHDKFLVHSPKTEHHRGGESRWVPIFPELRPLLTEAFELPDGAEYVINRYRDHKNLGVQFARIIKAAGLTPWPKLFHNLRATRQTELAADHPLHVACGWIGNKAAIAAEHYLTVTDDDFARAAKPTVERAANALHIGRDSARLPATPNSDVAGNRGESCSVGYGNSVPVGPVCLEQNAVNDNGTSNLGQSTDSRAANALQSALQTDAVADMAGGPYTAADVRRVVECSDLPEATKAAILVLTDEAHG